MIIILLSKKPPPLTLDNQLLVVMFRLTVIQSSMGSQRGGAFWFTCILVFIKSAEGDEWSEPALSSFIASSVQYQTCYKYIKIKFNKCPPSEFPQKLNTILKSWICKRKVQCWVRAKLFQLAVSLVQSRVGVGIISLMANVQQQSHSKVRKRKDKSTAAPTDKNVRLESYLGKRHYHDHLLPHYSLNRSLPMNDTWEKIKEEALWVSFLVGVSVYTEVSSAFTCLCTR